MAEELEKDPRDLNGDGKVSLSEKIQYGLKQAGAKAEEIMGEAKEKGKELYAKASDKAKETVDAAKAKVQEIKDKKKEA